MKFSNRIWSLGRVALVLSAGLAVSAQESGTLSGQIRSKEGKGIAGAQVRISAPQLIAARVVTTDANGLYRAPLLPAGEYVVSASAPGFIGSEARGVRIGIGSKLVQDLSLKAISDKASATVEVVANVAEQDKADTKAATNFSNEQLAAIPAATREFVGAADMSPGVVAGVSGSFAIRGGKTQSTQYTLNGVSIRDDYQGDNTSQRVIDDAIEDVQVVQSPLNARYGRTAGGIINVASKSGGNDFSGSIRYNLSRGDWAAWRPYSEENGITRANDYSDRSVQIFFSGPVIKDKLWFAVSSIQLPAVSSSTTITGTDVVSNYRDYQSNRAIAGAPGYGFDHGVSLLVGNTQDYFDGKLTYALTPDHTFDYSYQRSESKITNRNPYGTGSPIVATVGSHSLSQRQLDKYNSFGYKGTITSSVFVEARYSKLISESVFPSPMLDHVRVNMRNSGGGNNLLFPYGFNIAPAADARNNQSGDINTKIFLDAMGSHEIDTGVQFYEFDRGTQTQNGPNNSRFYTNYVTLNPWAPGTATYGTLGPLGGVSYPVAVSPSFGAGVDPYGSTLGFLTGNWEAAMSIPGGMRDVSRGLGATYRKYYGRDGITKNRTASIYVNDQWTINNKWGVMFGVRLDQMKIFDTDGKILVKVNAPISPRLKVTYDLAGDGARVISFTASRYNEDFTNGFTDAFVKKANTTFVQYGWTGTGSAPASGVATPAQLGLTWVNYASLTNPANYGHAFQFSDASTLNQGLSKLTVPYAHEVTLNFRRNYKEGHYVSASFVMKEWKNDFAIQQDWTNPYLTKVASPDPSLTYTLPNLLVQYGNSNELKRKFTSFELEFRNIINQTWVVGGNYTWSRLVGNTNGGDAAGQSFRDNSFSAPLYLRSWLDTGWQSASGVATNKLSMDQVAANGPLLNDATHKARIYLTAQVPLGKGKVTFSWLAKYDSGYNYDAVMPVDVGAAAFKAQAATVDPAYAGLPLTGNVGQYYTGRGAFRYNDSYDVDFKLGYELPFGVGKTALIGDIKVTNLLNNQRQLTWDTGFNSSTVPIGTPIAVGDPTSTGFGTHQNQYSNFQAARGVSATIGLKF